VTDLDDLVVRLRERADSLADTVTASPDLAGRARAGGRRRLVRRRAGQAVAATCVCAALILAAVTSSAWLPHGSRPAPDTLATRVYGQVGDSPTRGDLASDTAYTASALAAWAASHATSANADRGIFDDLRGRGRVVWAGTTPAGPGAIVAQQAFLHRHSNLQLDREGLHTLVGFIGVDAQGHPRVVADAYPAPGLPPALAWWVNPRRTVLAVLDVGEDLGLAASWNYRPDGTRSMSFTPLAFHDGAAIADFTPAKNRPAGSNKLPLDTHSVQVAALPYRGISDVRAIANADPSLDPACSCQRVDRRLMWSTGTPGQPGFPIAGTDRLPSYDSKPLDNAFYPALDSRLHGPANVIDTSIWYAGGALPDGRVLLLGEEALEQEPSHAYLVIVARDGSSAVVHGGPINPSSALPIAVQLPNGQGWLVAAKGATLSWRSSGGRWISAGPDAALLPARAVAVNVRTYPADTRTVQLTLR